MDEKTKWKFDEMRKDVNKNTGEIEKLNIFKASTIEQLKTLFESIKEIKEGNRAMSKLFITMIGGGMITVLTSLFIWLVQK